MLHGIAGIKGKTGRLVGNLLTSVCLHLQMHVCISVQRHVRRMNELHCLPMYVVTLCAALLTLWAAACRVCQMCHQMLRLVTEVPLMASPRGFRPLSHPLRSLH